MDDKSGLSVVSSILRWGIWFAIFYIIFHFIGKFW